MAKYILSIDGGGLRGLIPALVLAELSRRLEAKAGRPSSCRASSTWWRAQESNWFAFPQ